VTPHCYCHCPVLRIKHEPCLLFLVQQGHRLRGKGQTVKGHCPPLNGGLSAGAGKSPNSITLTFTETPPQGKSWTQTISTCQDVCDKVREKPICVTNGIWSVTMHGESRRQSPGQVHGKVTDLSRTQIIKVGDVICVVDFHDLRPRRCRELVPDFVAKSV